MQEGVLAASVVAVRGDRENPGDGTESDAAESQPETETVSLAVEASTADEELIMNPEHDESDGPATPRDEGAEVAGEGGGGASEHGDAGRDGGEADTECCKGREGGHALL